jgi:putative hydrolase of the HAD superfamily
VDFVLCEAAVMPHVRGMTILFDIGNVLLRFDYHETLHALIPAELGDAATRLRLLDEKREDLESGRIAVADFVPWALQTLGSRATGEQFIAAWRSIFTPIAETWELVEKLSAQGHRLILFSNINAIHHPWIFEAYPGFEKFHGAAMSYEMGVMKPHDAFYQWAIERYDLVPDETFYIDDLEANIATGEKFGFYCHQYDFLRHESLLEDLGKFLSIPLLSRENE